MVIAMDLSNEDKETLVLKFCECSFWAHDCWLFHRCLFDDNSDQDRTIGKAKYFTSTLSEITQEYVLLQLAKLHDKVEINGRLNVTVDSVFNSHDWGDKKDEAEKLRDKLLGLWTRIKTARHQILCHNDFITLKENTTHGKFTPGLDKKYFDSLQSLVNITHETAIGGPYPFNDHTETDVIEFLNLMRKV